MQTAAFVQQVGPELVIKWRAASEGGLAALASAGRIAALPRMTLSSSGGPWHAPGS